MAEKSYGSQLRGLLSAVDAPMGLLEQQGRINLLSIPGGLLSEMSSPPKGVGLLAAAAGQPPKTFYGYRPDGSIKGAGFMGELKRPNGDISTELSIGVNFDGREHEIPTLVPTLTQKEINHLLLGNAPTEPIVRKAVEHARMRMSQGNSPFAD